MSSEREQAAVRIQKLLASTGLASRRQAEAWIVAGRIRLNGSPARLGDRAAPEDVLTLDGRRLTLEFATGREVVAYHKPCGQVVSRSDEQGRPAVFSALPPPAQGRWISVGRLDLQTSGLLLLTTDGALAHRLMHPGSQILRRYQVRVRGAASREQRDRLCRGVRLDDGMARFEFVRAGRGRGVNRWYEVALREGRNREVRRLWQAVGLEVSRLIRIGYGPVELDRAHRAGELRWLSSREIRTLERACTATESG